MCCKMLHLRRFCSSCNFLALLPALMFKASSNGKCCIPIFGRMALNKLEGLWHWNWKCLSYSGWISSRGNFVEMGLPFGHFWPIQYFGLEFVAAKYAGAAISRGSHFMHHEVDYKDMSVGGGCYWHTEMLSFCRKDILDSMPRVVTLHFMLSTIQLLSQNGKLCACQIKSSVSRIGQPLVALHASGLPYTSIPAFKMARKGEKTIEGLVTTKVRKTVFSYKVGRTVLQKHSG